ncbi:LuxR C-terminal-related transcriptional regulator [Bradyrhizobium sp.]|uniref:LuxR C-terminal-related transcriptional regulator n=1 Tax=Bradyrhizobium sp. TaxID=376 RepID=UPI0039E359D1
MIMSSSPAMPTYILQEDNLLREGLRLLLANTGFCPSGCAFELDGLIGIPRDKTTLFIVGANHAVVCAKIRHRFPLALIAAIGDECDASVLASALESGADAALFISVSPSALIASLQALVDGKLPRIDARLWSRQMQSKTIETASPPLHDEADCEVAGELFRGKQLSSRELEILERIVRGETNKHIARFFSIAEPTVKVHVKNIFRKIGANNRTQAAMWALNCRQHDDMNHASHKPFSLQRH